MNKKGRSSVSLLHVFFIGFISVSFFATPSVSTHNPQTSDKSLRDGKQLNVIAQEGGKEILGQSKRPLYTEVEFSSIVGEILINPEYSGRIADVRTLFKTGFPRNKSVVDLSETADGWGRVTFSESEPDAVALIVTGQRGSLKISLPKRGTPVQADKLQPLNDLIISFGELNTTLITPNISTSEPGSLEIGILDLKEDKFINGDIIAVKGDQVAVKFHDLPATVVNEDGITRVNLKGPEGKFLNSDLEAWGYNVFVPETDVEKPSPIKAQVFGLPQDAKLKFMFESLSGQNITPTTRILSVKEINSGEPIVTIVTSIPGTQPLSVSVEKVH